MTCASLDSQSSVGSMCDSRKCRILELSVLVDMPLGVDIYHGAGHRGEQQHQLKVNIMFSRMRDKLTKDVPFGIYMADILL